MTTRVKAELERQSIYPGRMQEQILDHYYAALGTVSDFINVMKEQSGCTHAVAEAVVKAMGKAGSPDGRMMSSEYIKALVLRANEKLPGKLHKRLKKHELETLDETLHNFIIWRAFDSLIETEP